MLRVAAVLPEILPISVAPNGNLAIRITSESGRNYELQSANSLGPEAIWEPVSTTPGTDSILTIAIPIEAWV